MVVAESHRQTHTVRVTVYPAIFRAVTVTAVYLRFQNDSSLHIARYLSLVVVRRKQQGAKLTFNSSCAARKPAAAAKWQDKQGKTGFASTFNGLVCLMSCWQVESATKDNKMGSANHTALMTWEMLPASCRGLREQVSDTHTHTELDYKTLLYAIQYTLTVTKAVVFREEKHFPTTFNELRICKSVWVISIFDLAHVSWMRRATNVNELYMDIQWHVHSVARAILSTDKQGWVQRSLLMFPSKDLAQQAFAVSDSQLHLGLLQ